MLRVLEIENHSHVIHVFFWKITDRIVTKHHRALIKGAGLRVAKETLDVSMTAVGISAAVKQSQSKRC